MTPSVTARGSALLASIAALVGVLAFRSSFLAMDVATISTAATWFSVIAIVCVATAGPTKLWSAGLWFEVILAVFHLGLPWLIAFGVPFAPQYVTYLHTWFRDGSTTVEAIYLSILAVVAFAPAYALAARPRPDAQPKYVTVPTFARAGFLVTALGVLLTLGAIATTAPQLLHGGTVSEFNDTVARTGPINLGTAMVGLGAILTAAAPRSGWRKASLWCFAGYSVLMLSFGARTAAMYAILSFVLVAVRVRKMPRARVAVAVLVVGFLGIGILQQVRDTGVSTQTVGQVSLSPAQTLSETGGSLRAVNETLNWRQLHGEPLHHGQTYVVGLIRIYERVVGIPRPNPDYRFAGTLVASRVKGYQIGYSAVAEAYLNWGTGGVLGVFLLFGLVLGRLDAAPLKDPVAAARIGVVMYALAYVVRQASNVMLTEIIVGLVVVELLARRSRKREQAAVHPTPADRFLVHH